MRGDVHDYGVDHDRLLLFRFLGLALDGKVLVDELVDGLLRQELLEVHFLIWRLVRSDVY